MNHFGGDDIWVDEWNENWDNESYAYDRGVEYKMTAEGLEKIKSDYNTVEDRDEEDQDIDDLEQKLQKLKEDRENIEQDLEKTRTQKMQELEKIDRALEEKKSEKKSDKKESSTVKKTQQITTNAPTGLGKVAAVAKKAEELNLLIQRFTY
jgi:TolA-binding protein